MTTATREGSRIVAGGLTKRYGRRTAVDELSFSIEPGIVTGFLGPNGAGKTTTMRMIVGLTAPTAGTVTVGGRRFTDLPDPLRTVGVLLDAGAGHPGRTGFHHLLCLAHSAGIGRARVQEVIDEVGLSDVAGRHLGHYSLGMRQRLGLAAALLGNPAVLILDEPINGLDPEGIVWIRTLLRGMAEQGRTVLLSSHLMSEMALTADHLVVIGKGRLIADCPTGDLMETATPTAVRVRTLDVDLLTTTILDAGGRVRTDGDDSLYVEGLSSAEIGALALVAGVLLTELTPDRSSLEEAFLALTRDTVEFGTAVEATP